MDHLDLLRGALVLVIQRHEQHHAPIDHNITHPAVRRIGMPGLDNLPRPCWHPPKHMHRYEQPLAELLVVPPYRCLLIRHRAPIPRYLLYLLVLPL